MGSSPSLAVTQGQTRPCYLEDDWRAGGYDRHTEWIVIVRAHPGSAEPASPQGRGAVLGEPGQGDCGWTRESRRSQQGCRATR
ncbi:hypothetical protein GCM10010307_06960 [Streptomyces vastus]|uniref:Uncharacterized protein n=1 Tax=Streptomyces vastus TaxID=285451 RepID=A0ABN3QCV5_9ACTN